MNPEYGRSGSANGEYPWVFPWGRPRRRMLPGLLAVAATATGFAVLTTLVRVKVGGPRFEMEQRGSLLYLPGDGESGVWAMRAREAGPEITRYNPADWSGYTAWDRSLAEAATPPFAGYQPVPREWPDAPEPAQVELAIKGVPFLPARPLEQTPAPESKWRQVPALRALTPPHGASLPEELPPMEAGKIPPIPSDGARFLLRLSPDGGVADCLALSKDEGGNAALAAWLRGIRFDPKLAGDGEWFAVALTYHNRIDDGADNR